MFSPTGSGEEGFNCIRTKGKKKGLGAFSRGKGGEGKVNRVVAVRKREKEGGFHSSA